MNSICRLCLTVSNREMTKLVEGGDCLQKIEACLSLQLVYSENLPYLACKKCLKIIDEFDTFKEKVVNNQKKLYKILNEGDKEEIRKFLLKLYESIDMKQEKNELFCENKENEIENLRVKKEEQNNIATDDLISETNIEEKEILDEINEYSSDDDCILSSLEKTTKVKHSTKIIKKTSRKQTEVTIKSGQNQQPSEVQGFKSPILNNYEIHKCLTCLNSFQSQSDLLKHYHTEHESKKSKETMKYYSVLEKEGMQSFKCNKCERTYDNLRAIKRHLQAHIVDRPFICKLCGRTYRTVSEIIRHGRAHNGKRINCSFQCGYSTVYAGALKEHEKRHRTEFKYKCEKCDKGFQVRTWYEEHQNIHNGVKPFVCSICGLSFYMNRYLTAHRSTVHPQTSDLKRYICMHCSLPCDSRKALTVHLKDHGIVKSFLCDICGKTLSSKEQLKFHKRVHLGERPYACSVCNKSFTKKCNLKLHEETHTEDRTHKCSKCGKMYKQRSTLVKHSKKHCRALQ